MPEPRDVGIAPVGGDRREHPSGRCRRPAGRRRAAHRPRPCHARHHRRPRSVAGSGARARLAEQDRGGQRTGGHGGRPCSAQALRGRTTGRMGRGAAAGGPRPRGARCRSRRGARHPARGLAPALGTHRRISLAVGCAFCDGLAAADLAAENELAAALPDTFPPTRGHTLVVPRRHQADYSALTADEQSASTWFTATRATWTILAADPLDHPREGALLGGPRSCGLLRRGLALVRRQGPAGVASPMSRKSESPKLGAPIARALPERWLPWLVPVLIALITFAAFLPALQNQFVNWDDMDNLLDNPHYRGLGWTHLRWMWTTHLGPLHSADLDDPRPGLPALGHESRRVSSDQSPPARPISTVGVWPSHRRAS